MAKTFKDYYALLHLPFEATDVEIKHAYRRMARENHPDLHVERQSHYTARLQELNEAYSTLSIPEVRAEYDWRYRQQVLGQGPQYEYVTDTAAPDLTPYRHTYTNIKRRLLLILGWLLLAVILFRYLR